ncbi:MAG: hypothetical protein QOJ54_1565 [Aliidongia sp.]|nr:hypothetical protein [Aliidongia sp.]
MVRMTVIPRKRPIRPRPRKSNVVPPSLPFWVERAENFEARSGQFDRNALYLWRKGTFTQSDDWDLLWNFSNTGMEDGYPAWGRRTKRKKAGGRSWLIALAS